MKRALTIDSDGQKKLTDVINDTLASNNEDITYSGKFIDQNLIINSHNVKMLGTKEVDETNIGDGKFLVYNSITDKLEYQSNSFLEPIDFSSSIVYEEVLNNSYTTQITKIGKLINVTINCTIHAYNAFTVKVGTIPQGTAPINNVNINTISNKGKACYIYIGSNHIFGFTLTDSSETWEEDDGCRMTFSYITNE